MVSIKQLQIKSCSYLDKMSHRITPSESVFQHVVKLRIIPTGKQAQISIIGREVTKLHVQFDKKIRHGQKKKTVLEITLFKARTILEITQKVSNQVNKDHAVSTQSV
jgi:hypothetical protein